MIPNEQHPMMEAGEIADLLGWRTAWFRRQMKKLISEDGMPAPLPGGRWHRATLMRWIEAYGDMKAKAGADGVARIRIQWDRAALEEKYAGRAA